MALQKEITLQIGNSLKTTTGNYSKIYEYKYSNDKIFNVKMAVYTDAAHRQAEKAWDALTSVEQQEQKDDKPDEPQIADTALRFSISTEDTEAEGYTTKKVIYNKAKEADYVGSVDV